jgi:undecaprenyl-diphosphatase
LEHELEFRKDFEVALHAGTAAAVLIGGRADLAGAAWLHDRRAAVVLGLALTPPALAGLALEERIEGWGTPGRIAGGLVVGSLGLAVADRLGRTDRDAADARPLDGLLLGLAQAAALAPGVSRNGATLAVGRARGFTREAADELSRDCGLGVILGAVALRGLRGGVRRAARRPLNPRAGTDDGSAGARLVDSPGGRPIIVGGVAAFCSTVVARRVLGRRSRAVSLVGCAAYRTALAGAVWGRVRRVRRVA